MRYAVVVGMLLLALPLATGGVATPEPTSEAGERPVAIVAAPRDVGSVLPDEGLPAYAHFTDVASCPQGYGLIVTVPFYSPGVCVTYRLPSTLLPSPVFPDTGPCPAGQHGTNVTWLNSTAGACYTYDYEQPQWSCNPNYVQTCAWASITDCEAEAPVDPAVYVLGGGVVACGFLYLERGGDFGYTIDADLSPCPYGFDPTVFVSDGFVQVCVFS